MTKMSPNKLINYVYKTKILLPLVILIVLGNQTPSWAQLDQGTFRIGGQAGFGTDIESLGIGLRGDYALTPKLLIATDFMYFFSDKDFGVESNWFDVNFNGNYLIEINNSNHMLYVLGGLNIARTSLSCKGLPASICEDFSQTSSGFNLGGGMDFMLGSIALFGEIRVTLGDASQVVLAGGVKLPLN